MGALGNYLGRSGTTEGALGNYVVARELRSRSGIHMESSQVQCMRAPHASAAIPSASITLACAETYPNPSTRLPCTVVRRTVDARSLTPRLAYFSRG